MPIFFLNYKNSENKFYIVDGQQRLYCITQFRRFCSPATFYSRAAAGAATYSAVTIMRSSQASRIN